MGETIAEWKVIQLKVGSGADGPCGGKVLHLLERAGLRERFCLGEDGCCGGDKGEGGVEFTSQPPGTS